MKNFITFFVAISAINLSYSQDKKTENPQSETQTKIRVFTPSSSSSAKTSSDNSYKWAVKTDIFSILTGEFPLIGEYRISPKFSVEASAALTYGYITNDISLNENDELDAVPANNSYTDSDSAEMGSAFRASFKYFPSADYDAIEGWYFGVQAMTKTTNRGYADNSDYKIDGKDSKIKTGAAIIIGKQVFQDSNIVWDFYFGAGIANVKHKFYSYAYDSNTDEYTVNQNENSKSKPNILFGLRVGFGN